MRYFLYARKSTDTEDKQVLSIEAQLAELRALARRDDLDIAQEFVEKRSAKTPGRPVFEDMMRRVERGEAQGILCWKIDRLSRNPVDSGRVSWLLQQGTIAKIITHERVYLPHDNVLLMSVEFGMANQYIRDLSVNTARGLRAKARRGIFPGQAPLGYRNDVRTKTITVDTKKAPIVRAAFELYAKNGSRFEDIARFLFDNGIHTKPTKRWKNGGARPLKKDQIKDILTNPFYYGHFRYCGETYEGTHTPIISKALFDKVQSVIALRCRKHKPKNEPQALCGLLTCGICGCSITGEVHTKKSGRRYVYYRCTKKRGACDNPFMREEALDAELSDLLSRFHLPRSWAKELERMAQKDAQDASESTATSISALRAEIAGVDTNIARLTDLYVAQDIERDEYLERKRDLMSRKRSAQENILRLEKDAGHWLEPMRKWIQEAQTLEKIAESEDLSLKKSSLQKIFGSNLTLNARAASGTAQPHWLSLVGVKESQYQNPKNPDLDSCLVRKL